ncbi:poly(A)-binding protein binding protein [Conoideocrella luteorostrata]|uniref:Poly(A)-binding protein binding protein n=1 Tax=Conoideocrella luteorostrata TaxID=1105319 RepID=A0AAJ0FTN3_9HYPO|nr:poly(A)-binding protein binding protein [Conoideocrella luteorostrata]
MPGPKKDGGSTVGSATRSDGRSAQNGNRSNFRTDAAISNSRFGGERALQPWVPDAGDKLEAGLEGNASAGHWDQFAANEKLFGLKSDYDENIYTTTINKSHPQYRERIAAAERKAKEIERSTPATAHVAEERVMDFVGGGEAGEENEEDKYSGVRRQDFPPLSGGTNKYTPPARRAPTSQTSVKGAPVDPAIISSQLKAPARKQQASAEQPRPPTSEVTKNGVASKADISKPAQSKARNEKLVEAKPSSPPAQTKTPEAKSMEKVATAGSSSASSSSRNASAPKDSLPSATSTVEQDVLKQFKSFASQQRMMTEKARSSKVRADKVDKLNDLKQFASNFKLSTPVPNDLVSIIAKDPAKQREIQAKALKNAQDMAKTKFEGAVKDKTQLGKDATPAKPSEATAAAVAAPDGRASRAPAAPQAPGSAGNGNRHAGPRQQFSQQGYHNQPYRNNRGGPQHTPPQQQTGSLAQRLRHVEQQRYSQPPAPVQHTAGHEMRAPPTGPSSNVDSGFSRRSSGAPGQMGAKLNPNSHEFRPSPFAAAFNPNSHASASSSPRTSVNNVAESPAPVPQKASPPLIRRKTKAVDVKKCRILSHIQTLKPPQGRNWNDNGGLRPSYDTLPTWRQLQDDEKPDSTMHLTYNEHFERQPFNSSSVATPNPPHVAPQHPHQHQLPFYLQHGAHSMGPRQSPHMPHMQMHTQQHGPVPHTAYGSDDHRMMHSNSAQSFASPRMGQLPVAYPTQGPYSQPLYMGSNNAQLGQYRSFSNNPHYMPPQGGQMGGPMMMQPQFLHGPQGMVPAPQMMYHAGHPQFMPPSGPPQPGPGGNGYPSPGRPAAPVMVHQGSQQGQQMYGMSPNVQYNQPYGPGQPSGPGQ